MPEHWIVEGVRTCARWLGCAKAIPSHSDQDSRTAAADGTDEHEVIRLAYALHRKQPLSQLAHLNQTGPLDAGQQAALDRWGVPDAVELDGEVGDRRLGDLAALVHHDDVVGLR